MRIAIDTAGIGIKGPADRIKFSVRNGDGSERKVIRCAAWEGQYMIEQAEAEGLFVYAMELDAGERT